LLLWSYGAGSGAVAVRNRTRGSPLGEIGHALHIPLEGDGPLEGDADIFARDLGRSVGGRPGDGSRQVAALKTDIAISPKPEPQGPNPSKDPEPGREPVWARSQV
jgi:hypothetical protein